VDTPMNDKEVVKAKADELIALTSEFCDKYLDEDYKLLCEKLIKKMSRKKVVPFLSGRIKIWAASIIYALGSINFLFDRSFEPYIEGKEIALYFETSPNTVSQKARFIKDMFNLDYFNGEFSTQRSAERNPLRNLTIRDGFIIMGDGGI
jgi:hypothetical protein